MNTKYYVDSLGNYLGGFQGATPPEGSMEVPFAPGHAKDKWNGTGYTKDPVRDKEEHNKPILEQISALDIKRIRSIAENDPVYLDSLTKQVKALRATLK